jgi:hypothetical protein
VLIRPPAAQFELRRTTRSVSLQHHVAGFNQPRITIRRFAFMLRSLGVITFPAVYDELALLATLAARRDSR